MKKELLPAQVQSKKSIQEARYVRQFGPKSFFIVLHNTNIICVKRANS